MAGRSQPAFLEPQRSVQLRKFYPRNLLDTEDGIFR